MFCSLVCHRPIAEVELGLDTVAGRVYLLNVVASSLPSVACYYSV